MTEVTQADHDLATAIISELRGYGVTINRDHSLCLTLAQHRIDHTRPASTEPADALADTMPGHWDTEAGAEIAREYLGKDRVDLAMGDVSDLTLANAQYLVSRDSFELIHYQTAAKERIRWLSAQLAALTRTDALAEARDALLFFQSGCTNGECEYCEKASAALAKINAQGEVK